MTDTTELQENVVTEMQASHEIAAMQLLPEHRGIGLKEARELADDCLARRPV